MLEYETALRKEGNYESNKSVGVPISRQRSGDPAPLLSVICVYSLSPFPLLF